MKIRITINKPLVIESVKNETFHKGQMDKTLATANQSGAPAIAVAYHEQAGDETYHERILDRGFFSNLGELKTYFTEYLTASGQTAGDNVTETTEGNNIILTLSVTDRFNTSFTDPLAKLCAEYITNAMLMDWWRPVNKEQSALYATFMNRNLTAINRCFIKTAPIVPDVPYTTELNITGSAIDIGIGEDYTIAYSISDGAIDDIEVRVEDPRICGWSRCEDGFVIIGKKIGHTPIVIFSRHNTEISHQIEVYVQSQN